MNKEVETTFDVGISYSQNEHSMLTKILEVTMLNTEAFSKAVERGIIKVREDGTLAWMLENQTLLAYFCGRLWSGDCGRFSRRKGEMLWQMGKEPFPAVALGRLFGVSSLKQTRNRRKNSVLPEHHELIDLLFVSNE